MNRIALLLASAVLATVPASAQQAQFSGARMEATVKEISDDRYQGRGPATPGEKMTIDYMVKQLQAAGVQPGGELVNGKRQWTQRVPLLKSDIVGDPIFTVQTGKNNYRLQQTADIAVRATMNGSNQIRITGAPLVFAGYGTSAPERGWDDFKGQDVKGKILVVLINDPDFEGGEGDFGGKAMTYYGRWTYKYEEAARRGAAGVMIVHETEPASYGWNTVKNSNANTMFDIVRQDPASAHTPFESWITLDTAKKIFADAGLDFDQMKAAARRKDFRPVDLKATLGATANAKTETITSYNVVGRLPGKTHPDETVIYSGHYDHIGIGAPDANGDTIYNGAVDNATGIAHVLEQARAFAKEPRTDRSIVFLAVTAEEKGLLGTEYYVSNPLYPLEKTVAVLNTDSMGVNGPARNFSISGTARLDLLDRLIASAQTQGRSFTPDPRPEAGGFFRSDHFPFAKRGVPAVSFRSGNDLVNGGTERGNALAADYTEKRYHQQDDEYQPGWDFSGMVQDAQLLHMVGRALANSTDWPNWSADSEFRATRDESAAQRGGAASTPAADPGERG